MPKKKEAREPEPPYDSCPYCPLCTCDFNVNGLDEYFFNDPEPKPGIYPAVDVENMTYWMYPAHTSIYRISELASVYLNHCWKMKRISDIALVIYNPRTQQYHITGIAQWDRGRHSQFTVPWDPEKGLIGVPRMNDPQLVTPATIRIGCEDAPERPEDKNRLTGFVIHPCCLRAIQICLGRAGEENLAVLARSLQSGYYDVRKDDRTGSFADRMECEASPLRSVLVRSLIQQSRTKDPWKKDRLRVSPRSPPPKLSQLSFLPAEIQCLIMNYLSYKDVLKLQKTIVWTFPLSYWKRRIDTQLFFEVREILDEDGIDWQFLALKLEEEAGPVRRYLCELLEGSVRRFYRLLEDG